MWLIIYTAGSPEVIDKIVGKNLSNQKESVITNEEHAFLQYLVLSLWQQLVVGGTIEGVSRRVKDWCLDYDYWGNISGLHLFIISLL